MLLLSLTQLRVSKTSWFLMEGSSYLRQTLTLIRTTPSFHMIPCTRLSQGSLKRCFSYFDKLACLDIILYNAMFV